MEGIPRLDPSPHESAPFGHFDEHEKNTIADPIEDLDAFAARVAEWQDSHEHYDESDEVRKLEWAVLASVPGKAIKVSGLFADKQEARDQAKKAGHDGLFDAWVVPVGRFFPFGPGIEGHESVEGLAREFGEGFNRRIDTMKARLESKDDTDATKEPEEEEVKTEEEDVKTEEEEVKTEEVDKALLKKMKACLSRGDAKGMRQIGQRHVVIGHMQVEYGKSYLIGVFGAFEDADTASRQGKMLADEPPQDVFGTDQRVVDFVVGSMYEWKPFPFDFMANVEKTHSDSRNLEKLMQSSMYRQSTEYKSAVKNLRQFHDERQAYESDFPALPAPSSDPNEDEDVGAGASGSGVKKSSFDDVDDVE